MVANYTYANGVSVPGVMYNGTIEPGYYLPNGTVMLAGFYANFTPIALEDCTFDTCNREMASQLYAPNMGEQVAFAAIFGLLLLAQIPLGIRYRTWGFTVGAFLGFALEIVGYIGRIMMHNNLWDDGAFIIYICCLTIAPAFLTAAIYLCLARIIVVYGQHIARFRPFVYTIVFMVSDFVSLVLQGAGGGLASTADDKAGSDLGVNVMIAGLAFQVVSLVIFMALCTDFAISAMRKKDLYVPAFSQLRNSLKFKAFLGALALATITIFIRSIYRVVELKAGFKSEFANNETTFLVLESIMLVIAGLAITILHPGLVYGKENWAAANFKMTKKQSNVAPHKESPSISDAEMQPLGSTNIYHSPPK